MNTINKMRVAVGIIKKNDKYLVCQRRADKKNPLEWEFPGGKFNIGETSLEALHRELKEELGVDITNVRFIRNVKHQYDYGLADIDFYFCDTESNNFILTEHDNIAWVTLDELENMNYVASISQIINYI